MIQEIKHWKTDVPAGLVVFLVAIPLCLGIALASGAPAMSGIIAGICGGLIVTLFSNSSLGVSGPAAGLVAIVLPAIKYLGFENFLIAVVLSGVIQYALGYFRAGTIGNYFPTAVIKGMLAGIGLIIILKQIPHAFGYDKDFEGDMALQQSDGHNTFSEIWYALQASTPAAIIISVTCLAILILWETQYIKQFKFSKIIQGPLVAVVAGILLFLAFSATSMNLSKDHLVSLPTSFSVKELTFPRFDPSKIGLEEDASGEGADSTGQPTADDSKDAPDMDSVADTDPAAEPTEQPETEDDAPDESSAAALTVKGSGDDDTSITTFGAMLSILVTAMTLAVVASLESLLCAEATDKLDPQRRQTDLNKELRAQGIGNFISGLIGGLPVTQVIVRSSTNIQSGAQSRLAAFVHGIFLIVCVLAIPKILNMIPLASLAAILLVVGYKLAHPSKFKAMFDLGWTQFLPFIITIGAILATDLLRGIGIGLVASLFFILKDSYFKSVWVSESEEDGKKVYRLTLAERVFFINKGDIGAVLTDVQPGSKVVIDASNTIHIDQDVTDLFNDFETNAQFNDIELVRLDFEKEVKSNADPARVKGI